MGPLCHFGVSTITGVITYALTKSLPPSIACFCIGWLVDVDHFWDFYKNFGKIYSIKRFLKAVKNEEFKKSYLYFHSYELLLVLVILCFYTDFHALLSFTTLGLALHLFFDQAFNPVRPFTYFIAYRIAKHFEFETIFKPKRKIPTPATVQKTNIMRIHPVTNKQEE